MDIKQINSVHAIKLMSVHSGEAFMFTNSPCVRVCMPNKLEEIVLSNMPYELRNKDIFVVDIKSGDLFLADGDTSVVPLRNSYFAVENVGG